MSGWLNDCYASGSSRHLRVTCTCTCTCVNAVGGFIKLDDYAHTDRHVCTGTCTHTCACMQREEKY